MKYHEEYFIQNAYFFKHASRYCNIYDKREFNQLEVNFLKSIDYRLKVEQDEFDRYFSLIFNRAQELQCNQFRVYDPHYTLVEDYFSSPKAQDQPTKASQNIKAPLVFLNGKLFKDSEELYHFFNCEEICEDKTSFSDNSSIYTLSEDSPKLV
jgi:hypothetical protein